MLKPIISKAVTTSPEAREALIEAKNLLDRATKVEADQKETVRALEFESAMLRNTDRSFVWQSMNEVYAQYSKTVRVPNLCIIISLDNFYQLPDLVDSVYNWLLLEDEE